MNVATTIRPIGRPGDLGWVVMAHGEVYAAQFGWDVTFEEHVAGIVADFVSDAGTEARAAGRAGGWIAERAGARVGCVVCVPGDAPTTARLRTLLVTPDGRGDGLGGRLVDTCVGFARSAGYQRLRLGTNASLAAARRIYESRGFALVEEEPHHSFGMDLVALTYELAL